MTVQGIYLLAYLWALNARRERYRAVLLRAFVEISIVREQIGLAFKDASAALESFAAALGDIDEQERAGFEDIERRYDD